MRLTVFTDLSLRVLMFMAVQPDRLVTIDEMTDVYGCSRNHLMKIVHVLSRLGYIETRRGKHGGARLARDPATIIIGDLVRHTEEDLELVECFSPARNRCAISPSCRMKHVFNDARSAFLAVLDAHTLADITGNSADLLADMEIA